MKTIWKFIIATTDYQEIEIPQGAEFLSVQIQKGDVCLWALVDPHAPVCRRVIATHGTGHPVRGTAGDYIGTYQLADGDLVFHVFVA